MKNIKTLLGSSLGAAALLCAYGAWATEVDLTTAGVNPLSLAGSFGGTAYFQNFNGHPTGTGVFDPFLTLERDASGGKPAGIEGAYNSDAMTTGLLLDQQRPNWNKTLKLGDLAKVTLGQNQYYAFELDANEPGGGKQLISIDNIRVYTSATDNTLGGGITEANLNNLGTLRWAMNDPLKDAQGNYIINNWVKLDSTQGDTYGHANGGSGWSDMIAYIPVSAFAGALATDYLWFYNLNGVHYTADASLAAEAGYEEWRAVVGPSSVPDGGSTLMLLGFALSGLGAAARWLKK